MRELPKLSEEELKILVKKISESMNIIRQCASKIEEETSIVYNALCNCCMEWLSKSENYKEILQITINQFIQFVDELDKIREMK